MDSKLYATGKDGKTRVKPRQSVIINGVVCGAGTEVKLNTKPVESEVSNGGEQ